jgi:hypothetical protein
MAEEPENFDDLRWCKCGHQACVHLDDGCGICPFGKCKAFELDASRPIPTMSTLDELKEFDELLEPVVSCLSPSQAWALRRQ